VETIKGTAMKTVIGKAAAIMALAIASVPALANTVTITYLYDQAGRVTAAYYSNGVCITYDYDAAGNRLTKKIQNTTPTTQPKWGSETYGCFRWST
jgi:YD repeat-containing protein